MAMAWMSWSSGKDSTLALHIAREELGVDVVGLLVTLNAEADRVAMHAVRRTLLEAQAQRLGLPLRIVEIPSPCPNDPVYPRQAGTWRHSYIESSSAANLVSTTLRLIF